VCSFFLRYALGLEFFLTGLSHGTSIKNAAANGGLT